jgi:hypothetical protein
MSWQNYRAPPSDRQYVGEARPSLGNGRYGVFVSDRECYDNRRHQASEDRSVTIKLPIELEQ